MGISPAFMNSLCCGGICKLGVVGMVEIICLNAFCIALTRQLGEWGRYFTYSY